jgi:hypothetical protein
MSRPLLLLLRCSIVVVEDIGQGHISQHDTIYMTLGSPPHVLSLSHSDNSTL